MSVFPRKLSLMKKKQLTENLPMNRKLWLKIKLKTTYMGDYEEEERGVCNRQ